MVFFFGSIELSRPRSCVGGDSSIVTEKCLLSLENRHVYNQPDSP